MEDLLQVVNMIFSSSAFDHYVINVYLHYATNQGLEDLCHQSLIGDVSIFESEQHYLVTIKSIQRYKDSFFFVHEGHGDLMVSGEGV